MLIGIETRCAKRNESRCFDFPEILSFAIIHRQSKAHLWNVDRPSGTPRSAQASIVVPVEYSNSGMTYHGSVGNDFWNSWPRWNLAC